MFPRTLPVPPGISRAHHAARVSGWHVAQSQDVSIKRNFINRGEGSVKSKPDTLTLVDLEYSQKNGEIIFQLSAGDQAIELRACANDVSGIRSIDFSDHAVDFLAPLCLSHPPQVKMMLALTWAYIDGEPVDLPVSLL